MPNWTENCLKIEGDDAAIALCINKIKNEEAVIDFNQIVPMPEILRNTGKGSTTINGRKVDNWFVDNTAPLNQRKERLFTPEESAELRRIGFNNWYDWSCEHWGVKWNASESEILEQDTGYIEIKFQTPWDAPAPILKALREQFPDLEFSLRYRLEDDNYYPHEIE